MSRPNTAIKDARRTLNRLDRRQAREALREGRDEARLTGRPKGAFRLAH